MPFYRRRRFSVRPIRRRYNATKVRANYRRKHAAYFRRAAAMDMGE